MLFLINCCRSVILECVFFDQDVKQILIVLEMKFALHQVFVQNIGVTNQLFALENQSAI